jgi:hypothetical protein
MRKVKILTSKKEIEEISARTDIKILCLDIKAVEQSYSFQESICAVVCYEDDLNIIESKQRAEFAKAAMQGLLSNGIPNNIGVSKEDYLAHWSVRYADCLISKLKNSTT